MKKSHALAYLRQLCCSELSSELITAEFLRSVSNLIQSSNNGFSVCDQQLNAFYHVPGFEVGYLAASLPVILDGYHTPERLGRLVDWFNRNPTLVDPRIMDLKYYSGDMYNLFLNKFDMHYTLWARIAIGDSQAGVLALYRSKNQRPFDTRDQDQLSGLLPYLSYAFQPRPSKTLEYESSASNGLLIANLEGKIIYQCSEGQRLLQLAESPRILIDKRQTNRTLLRIRNLTANLVNIYRGLDGAVPAFEYANAYGWFGFRGYWLNEFNSQKNSLIGITVEYREPLTLKVLKALRQIPLSPTQKEVALLLAKGASFEQIGQQLHIKQNTVKDHAGKIYLKLNIRQRGELLPLLLNGNAQA